MADTTIDRLEIELEATAKGTTAAFIALENKLSALQRAMDVLDLSKLQNAQKAVDSASKSSGGVSINTSGIDKAKNDVSKGVAKIEQELAGLQSYANAAMSGASSAFTSFERRVVSIQSAIDVLNKKFAQLGDIKLPTKMMSDVQAEMEKTESALESLKAKEREMTDSGGNPIGGITQNWIDLQYAIRDTKESYDELKAKQDELSNSGQAWIYPLDPYKEQLSQLQDQLTNTATTVREAYAEMNQTPEVKPDNSGLRETSKEALRARANLQKMFDGAVAKAFDSIVQGAKRIGSALLGIGKHADNAFGKGFMKLLKYGLGIRSLYVLFRRLRKAVTDSFGSLQESGAFFETTRANIEGLKNSLSTLKFQFGAAFEPIFNAVAPALQTLVNYLVTVMNVISAFMAKLTGKSTYSKVSAVFDKTASSAGGAGKAVKDLNKQLQGFDELNNLSENNSGGGGGGGGGGASGAGAMYEEASVDSVLGDFGKNLAEMIRKGDWKGVGTAISDKLSEAMESINWPAIYKKAKNFGKGLADFLNGLLTPRLFSALGQTLAGCLNTAFAFLNSFGTTFNWTEFGKSIAAGINKFFQTFDFKQAGQALYKWIGGLIDAATAMLNDTDFKVVGEKIGELIKNLNIPDLIAKLWNLAKAILKALGDAISGFWNNSDVSGKILGAIVLILGSLVFTNKLNTLATNIVTALGGQLNGKLISVPKLLIAVGTYEFFGKLTAGILEASADVFGFKELADEYRKFMDHPITYTFEGIVDIASFIAEDGFGKFGKVLTEVFSPNSEWVRTLKGIFGYKEQWQKGKEGATIASIMANQTAEKEKVKISDLNQQYEKPALDADVKKALDKADELNEKIGGQSSDSWVNGYLKNLTNGKKTLNDAVEDIFGKQKTTAEKFGDISGAAWQRNYGKAVGETSNNKNVWKNVGSLAKKTTAAITNGLNALPKETAKVYDQAYKQGQKSFNGKKFADDFLDDFGKEFRQTTPADTQKILNQTFKDGEVEAKKAGESIGGGLGSEFTLQLGKSLGGTNKIFENAAKEAKKANVWNSLKKSVEKTSSAFKTLGTNAKNAVKKIKDSTENTKKLAVTSTQAGEDIRTSFNNVPATIGEVMSKVTTNIDTNFSRIPNKINQHAQKSWSNFKSAFSESNTWSKTTSGGISSGFSDLPTEVEGTFKTAYKKATQQFKDILNWATYRANDVKRGFNGMPGSVARKFHDAYNQGTAQFSTTQTWIEGIVGNIKAALGVVPGDFKSSFEQAKTNAYKEVAAFRDWFNIQKFEKQGKLTISTPSVASIRGAWSELADEWHDKHASFTIGVSASIEDFKNTLNDVINQFNANVGTLVAAGVVKNFRPIERIGARGGVVTSPTGVIAGDAGPEALVPLENNLGWLGKMATMIVGEMAKPNIVKPAATSSISFNSQSSDNAMVAEQNALLREEVQLLRQIAGKEFGITESEVFNAVRRQSNNYYKRTGASPFLI